MRPVTFRFDLEKLVHALAFFASNNVNDLTKLKAAKLVYFLDKRHLWRYGRPIVGGTYYCMQYGPVPGDALDVMNRVIDAGEVPLVDAEVETAQQVVEVTTDGPHPRFAAKVQFDPDVFSRSELALLEEVRSELGYKTAGELVNLTHQDPTWLTPNQGRSQHGRVQTPYQLFFEDASREVRKIWTMIQAAQETQEEDDLGEPQPANAREASVC